MLLVYFIFMFGSATKIDICDVFRGYLNSWLKSK